jgi:hypothetical protein
MAIVNNIRELVWEKYYGLRDWLWEISGMGAGSSLPTSVTGYRRFLDYYGLSKFIAIIFFIFSILFYTGKNS